MLRALVVSVAALFLAALWQAGRDLPRPAVRWLERELCRGPVCVRFEHAAFSLRRGVLLRDVRVFLKRRLGPPCLTAAELRFNGRIRHDRPMPEWIDAIYARQLDIRDLPPAPTNGNWRTPALTVAGRRLTATAHDDRPLGGWFARPVRLDVDDLILLGVRAERVELVCQVADRRLTLDRLRMTMPSHAWNEQLEGSLTYDLVSRSLQAQAEGNLTPEALAPLFERYEADEALRIVQRFGGFTTPPRVSGEMLREAPNDATARPARLDARLFIDGTDLTYRDLPVRRLHVALQWFHEGAQRHLTISPLVAEGLEGTLDCSLVRYPDRRVSDLTLRSSLPFATLAAALAMDAVKPELLRFDSAPRIEMRGRYASTNSAEITALQGRAECERLTIARLQFDRVAAGFEILGTNRIALSDLAAGCHQGGVSGALELTRPPEGGAPRFACNLAFTNIGIASAGRQLGASNTVEGAMEGRIALAGQLDARRLERLQGEGKVTIRKGEIMRVPLFAGFTAHLCRTIPGIDSLIMQSDAKFPFAITNGLLNVAPMLVEGNVFSLRGSGVCRLRDPDMPLDFVAQARLFKQKTLAGLMARVVTFPFSKLMEFKIAGTLKQPEWTYIGLIDRLRDLTWGADDNGAQGASGEEAQ
ncbi:MAG: AsmA-like C-terminal region-containing protein [Kiritimatiellae bacterium]|nr:AsmA-like C-terminal region-containing protein [Kiritimatiellia bacterium]